jgi:hypothetical protein
LQSAIFSIASAAPWLKWVRDAVPKTVDPSSSGWGHHSFLELAIISPPADKTVRAQPARSAKITAKIFLEIFPQPIQPDFIP